MTVEEIVPHVEALPPEERLRLLQLITGDASSYSALPPNREEFSCDEDLLSWDSEGWENLH